MELTLTRERSLSLPLLAGAILLASFFIRPQAHAATIYFRGTGSVILWSSTHSWTGLSVPTHADTVIFGSGAATGNATVDTPVDVAGIKIEPSYSGTITQQSKITVGSSNITMSGGTFNGAASGSAITASGFTLYTGTFKSTSGSLTVRGDFRVESGTFNAGHGTLVMAAKAASQMLQTLSTTKLFNLTISNTAGGTSDSVIGSGSAVNCSGALFVNVGNFDLDTQNKQLHVTGNVTVLSVTQATMVTDQNWSVGGDVTFGALSTLTVSGGTLKLNGTTQTLSLNSSTVPTLEVGSTTATLGAGFTDSSSLQIDTGSTLALSSYTLTGSTVTFLNYGTLSRGTGQFIYPATSFLITDSGFLEYDAFKTSDSLYFTLTDMGRNLDGTTPDTVDITVTLATGDSETVTLTETGNRTGIFEGSIAAAQQSSTANNNKLETTSDTLVTATFTDTQGGNSNTDHSVLSIFGTSNTSGGGGGGGGGGGSRSHSSGGSSSTTTTTKSVQTVTGPSTGTDTQSVFKPNPTAVSRICTRATKAHLMPGVLKRLSARLVKLFGSGCN